MNNYYHPVDGFAWKKPTGSYIYAKNLATWAMMKYLRGLWSIAMPMHVPFHGPMYSIPDTFYSRDYMAEAIAVFMNELRDRDNLNPGEMADYGLMWDALKTLEVI